MDPKLGGGNRVNPKVTVPEGGQRLRRNWVPESPEGARQSLPIDVEASTGGGRGSRHRKVLHQPAHVRPEGQKARAAREAAPQSGLSLRRVPPRPPCASPVRAAAPGLPSRAAPRRAEWSRAAAAASRRRFKRSAGPWPGAAVVRPAPRSSPLFPPWFLSAPASNLAPGAPLARTPARRPGPRRRLLQPPPSDGSRRAGRVASPPSAPAAES